MNISVLYEDDQVLVLNKPSGLVVHADGKIDTKTIADWILDNYPDLRGVGEPAFYDGKTIDRPGIVHRLDKGTSGVLVVAKNQESFLGLKEQFKKREIEKIYNAFVYGSPKEKEGIIDRPIGRSVKDFRRWSAQRGGRGKLRKAETHYKVLESNETHSFLEIKPKTGRTHQIRVHLKAINHPVICDSLYAPKRECALGFERLALHALSISFKNIQGEILNIGSPLPQDFNNALSVLRGSN